MRLLTSINIRLASPVILLVMSSFTMIRGGGGEERVLIDGKELQDEKVITLEKDDTVYLEAYGIKPKSDINVKVMKMGIKWAEDSYRVDETGTIKAIMHVPEQKLSVNCEVTYYGANGQFIEKNFKFKVR